MSKRIDQKIIKFKGGKIEVKDMLEMEDKITIILKGEIEFAGSKNNHDGSVNMIYEFKPEFIEVEDIELDTEIRDEVPVEDIPFLR
jgi:hypothetical protein